jgi:hypothetical protein
MVRQKDDVRPEEALEECKQRVEELIEENVELRHAAQTFGDLAERLNQNRHSNPPEKGHGQR